MDINVYLFIVIALMLLIIMYLLFVLRRVRTQLALIKDALEDIKGGNLNRRILAGENDMTKTICYDINKIAVNSQAQLIRQRQSEQAYSLGMKQRLGIANAILHDPELLILDEPTNGLDPIGIAEVRDFIKTLSIERGKTILISSHILSEIALLADDIGIIDHTATIKPLTVCRSQNPSVGFMSLQIP